VTTAPRRPQPCAGDRRGLDAEGKLFKMCKFRDVKLKLGYDLEYLRRRSAAEDLRIMVRTIPVLLGRKVFFRS
jgi:hypothetical protein